MKRTVRIGFTLLLAWQVGTAILNVALAKWDWVVFDIACMSVVIVSWALTERSLFSIKGMDLERDATVAHYRVMLDDMRRSGNEQGEQYALTMLAIWETKRPVPLAPDDQESGGLPS